MALHSTSIHWAPEKVVLGQVDTDQTCGPSWSGRPSGKLRSPHPRLEGLPSFVSSPQTQGSPNLSLLGLLPPRQVPLASQGPLQVPCPAEETRGALWCFWPLGPWGRRAPGSPSPGAQGRGFAGPEGVRHRRPSPQHAKAPPCGICQVPASLPGPHRSPKSVKGGLQRACHAPSPRGPAETRFHTALTGGVSSVGGR